MTTFSELTEYKEFESEELQELFYDVREHFDDAQSALTQALDGDDRGRKISKKALDNTDVQVELDTAVYYLNMTIGAIDEILDLYGLKLVSHKNVPIPTIEIGFDH